MVAVPLVFLLLSCPSTSSTGEMPPPPGLKRCEVDLKASGLFAQTGTGASAKLIDSEAQLIGGDQATGATGDYLLQNDKIKVIVEKPRRIIGPMLTGGGIVDADIVRPSGQPGRDTYGRSTLIYGLGRISSPRKTEILSDGSSGGPAVVATTGVDVQHDLINLKALVEGQAGLSVDFVLDPTKALNVRTTTYYALSPGENRVRVLTAFCNDGTTTVNAPIIELMDIGAFELFNPGGCVNGLGSSGDMACILEPSKWFGSQGDGIAYAVRSQSYADPAKPVNANAALGFGGVLGVFVEGENINGVLTWADKDAQKRPGTFLIKAGGQKNYLRDFVVAEDLAGIHATLLGIDGVKTGDVAFTAKLPDGSGAAGARISIIESATNKMVALAVADATGAAKAKLAPGEYKFSAALEGRLIGPVVTATVAVGQSVPVALTVNAARVLNVTVKDPAGNGIPAKVTVMCSPAPCTFNADTYKQHAFLNADKKSAAMGFVPVTGQLSLTLPPGEYDVVVTRGPEYSAWPDTWPNAGHHVDLRTADASVNAVLGQVVDSTGWMSADLHVHAANSTDSAVLNAVRAANFLAEGVEVLLSTDHDVITDYAPTVKAIGAEAFIATMIGEETTTFTHGHFNNYPVVRDPSMPNGGAFDHANGEDKPTYRLTELFPAIKAKFPGAVTQLNHPRGGSGVLTNLKVDTATLATHGDPASFNMAPDPAATANDTRLFGDAWDSLEVANGTSPSMTVMNDWMTFLSRGTVRTSTGVSDTHYKLSDQGGYSRTYAKLGVDKPADFKPADFAEAIRKQHAFATNGPFLKVTARKVDAAGMPQGAPVDIGDTLSVNGAGGEKVEITVDVQTPEWMQIDRIELYSHASGREAVNGESNSTWPEARILDKKVLDPANLPLEPVALPGVNLRRVHVTEKFVVAVPKDNWFVVMVRSAAARNEWPLTDAQPTAWSNAILVDADGSGKYDDFPLKGQGLAVPLKPVARPPARVPTALEFQRAIESLINHKHE